ncbi:regulator of G-protein signaling 12-like isoform X2 [Glandiceps talaboti]
MHQTRRKKKRPVMAKLKTVEVPRGRNGYGFTLTGQSPCKLSAIVRGTPAEMAGLKSGDYVMAVNGENVAKLSHEQVVKLIGVSTSILRLTIAEKPRHDTDSSDDEYVVNRPRPRSHPRMKTRTPPTPTNDQLSGIARVDKVVEDLFRGTLFGNPKKVAEAVEETDEDEESDKCDVDCRLAPGHLSPFNKSGKFEVFLKKPQKVYERSVWTGDAFDDELMTKSRKNKHKYSERHHLPKPQKHVYHHQQLQIEQQQQQQQQQHYSRHYMSTPDPAMINRPMSPLEVSSILYPSLQPHVSAAVPLDIDNELDEDDLYLRVVVGYLGSIEIPADANLQTASLQAIRRCVRRLRMEQRVHTLVMMEITLEDVRLVTPNSGIVVVYPAEKLAFSGVCPDDKRFFGLVTMHGLEENPEMGHVDTDSYGSSCHVFIVDPDISQHHIHAKKAVKFGIPCTVDLETNGCVEFPQSSKPILRTLAKLYQDRHNGLYVNELQRAQVYMGGEYQHDARRSNSNSSNSDSGIGYCRDSEGMNGSGSGDRVMVVDVPKNGSGNYSAEDGITPNRLVVKADVMSHPSSDPYSTASSADRSAFNTLQNDATIDITSRLTLRARPDPKGIERPISRMSMYSNMDSNDSSNNQETMPRTKQKSKVHELQTASGDIITKAEPAGLPPSGNNRFSMYARVDNTAHRGELANAHGTLQKETQRVDPRRYSDGRMLLTRQDAKDVTGKGLKRSKNKKISDLMKSQSIESITVSDGELPVPSVGIISRSSSLRSVDSARDLHKQDAGRVASWAVGFERLLNDPMGLTCFTEFLKKEFSEENIAFWIACEKYKKITDNGEMQRMAREIYHKHLSKKANMPVNLDSHAKQEVECKLEHPSLDMYDFQQKQIFQLMKFDSYSRFLKNEVYKSCLLAEMEGKPLPIQQESQDSIATGTDTASSNRETKLSKKASKKEDKKKKEKEKKKEKSMSGDSSIDTTDDGEKRRKSILPWNRSKSGKKVIKAEKKEKKGAVVVVLAEEKENKVTTKTESVGSTGSRRSSLASGDVNRFVREASESSESMERPAESDDGSKEQKFCRVILPDNSTTVIVAKRGQSVRAALKLLCERRRIPIASMEVYDTATNELYGLDGDLSSLACKEVQVENRVMFRVELPNVHKNENSNKRIIGVKSKPNKAIIDVLRPIMQKYKLCLDGMIVHLNGSPVPLELNIEVATLEGQRVIIEPYDQYVAGCKSMGRAHLPRNGRLRKAESVDSTLDQSNVHVVNMKPAKSEEGLSGVGRAHSLDPLYPGANSTLSKFIRTGVNKDGITDGELRQGAVRSDLFDMLARAQHNRMEDQRGTASNYELPEFLKVAKSVHGNKLKRSPPVQKDKSSLWSSKSASDSENVDESNQGHCNQQRASINNPPPRPHSTPPVTHLQTMEFSMTEGLLPTHYEAEYIFGSNDDRLTPRFNDSEILSASYRDQNPAMEASFMGYPSLAANGAKPALSKTKSLSKNRDDLNRLSPSVFGRDHLHHHRSSPVVRFNINETESEHDTTVIESTNEEVGDDLDIDLDITITGSELPLPSPPTCDPNKSCDVDEPNYSPPPPLSSQEQAALNAPTRTNNIASLPKNPPPVPPKPALKGKPVQNEQQSKPNTLPLNAPDTTLNSSQPQRSPDSTKSPLLPSPSTHDLFFTPSPSDNSSQGSRNIHPGRTDILRTPSPSRLDEDRSLGRSIMGDQYSVLCNRQSRSRSGISMPSDSSNILQIGKEGDKFRITFV